jgi:hypothetical protein
MRHSQLGDVRGCFSYLEVSHANHTQESWIGCVLRAAKDSGEYPRIDPSVVDVAPVACNRLRLIGRSHRRSIRPTPEQLARLTEYFQRRDQRSSIPMTDIMWFAIHSARREAEICGLQLEDPMEERVAKLEANVEHIRSDVSDIKTDVRRLNDKIDGVNRDLSGKLDAINKDLSGKIDGVYKDLSGKIDTVIQAIADLKIGRALDRVWWLLMSGALLGIMARAFKWI